jgi:hypothetical protein
VRRNQLLPTLVVKSTLEAAMNATYRHSFGLIEKRARRVMLALSVLNNELLARPIGIYR